MVVPAALAARVIPAIAAAAGQAGREAVLYSIKRIGFAGLAVASAYTMSEALVRIAYAEGEAAPRIPRESIIDPNRSVEILATLSAIAAAMEEAGAGEAAELYFEGISDALSSALRHVVTEPIEKAFTVYLGSYEIDEDEIADSYSYEFMGPGMLAWALMASGLSTTSAGFLAGKAIAYRYYDSLRNMVSEIETYEGKAREALLDPHESSLTEVRSALMGLPEEARTAWREAVDAALDMLRRAWKQLIEAAVALAQADRLKPVSPADAADLEDAAAGALDAVEDILDGLENYVEPVIADLVNEYNAEIERLIADAAERYLNVIDWLIYVYGAAARRVYNIFIEMLAEAVNEYNYVMQLVAEVRGVHISVSYYYEDRPGPAPPGTVGSSVINIGWVG